MKITEIIKALEEELGRAGDVEVGEIALPPSDGECLDLAWWAGFPAKGRRAPGD